MPSIGSHPVFWRSTTGSALLERGGLKYQEVLRDNADSGARNGEPSFSAHCRASSCARNHPLGRTVSRSSPDCFVLRTPRLGSGPAAEALRTPGNASEILAGGRDGDDAYRTIPLSGGHNGLRHRQPALRISLGA